MRTSRRSGPMLTLTVLFALAMVASARHVDANTAMMRVSATVSSRVSLAMHSAPSDLVVQATDISRGFIDVAEPLVFHVQSNLNAPYTVEFHSTTPNVHRIEADATLLVPPLVPNGPGVLIPPAHGDHVYTVHLRIYLDPNMRPGRYPWPVRLSGAI